MLQFPFIRQWISYLVWRGRIRPLLSLRAFANCIRTQARWNMFGRMGNCPHTYFCRSDFNPNICQVEHIWKVVIFRCLLSQLFQFYSNQGCLVGEGGSLRPLDSIVSIWFENIPSGLGHCKTTFLQVHHQYQMVKSSYWITGFKKLCSYYRELIWKSRTLNKILVWKEWLES